MSQRNWRRSVEIDSGTHTRVTRRDRTVRRLDTMSCKSAGRSRPRVRLKCGEDRFPKSKLDKLKLDLAMQAQEEHRRRPTRCSLDVDQETYGYSPKVLIHGWQKRLMQVNEILRRLIDIKVQLFRHTELYAYFSYFKTIDQHYQLRSCSYSYVAACTVLHNLISAELSSLLRLHGFLD